MKPSGRASMILAGLLASAFLAGCPWDSPEAHLARGRELAQKQQHAEAIIEFKNYLQSKPKSLEVRFLLGRELLAQGNLGPSEIELQKAYDGRYARDLVAPVLAKNLFQQGKLDRVVQIRNAGELTDATANAELQTLYAYSLGGLGKRDQSLLAFRKAQEYVPAFAAAMIGEARIKASTGDLDGASAEVAQVLVNDANQIEGHILKGDIARLRNDPKGAIAAYQEAINRSPRNVPARVNLTAIYINSDDFDSAQKQVVELKRLSPGNPEVNYQDAIVALHAKDYARAAEAIRLTLLEWPNNGIAEALAGAISLANNQPEQAELHLQAGLKLAPQVLYPRRLLAILYLRRGDLQKADDLVQPVLSALPDNAVFLELGGEIALQRGRFQEAAQLLGKAGELNPQDSRIKMEAARAQFAGGNDQKAFDMLESTAKSLSNDRTSLVTLLLARLQRRQYDQAEPTWKLLQAAYPNDPLTYNIRAAIDTGKKNLPAAREALEHALKLQPAYYPALTNLASIDEQSGDVEAARNRYRAFLGVDKGSPTPALALAQLEARHGADAAVVLPLLTDARRRDPSSEQAIVALAAYHLSRNQSAEAMAVVEDGIVRKPNSLAILGLLAELQLTTGHSDQAIASYRKLIAVRPKTINYQMGLGQALVLNGQVGAATTVFSDALKSHPDAVEAQTVAMDTLLATKKIPEANQILSTIRKTSPKSPVLPLLEGDAKLAEKQYGEATNIYRKVVAQAPTSKAIVKLSNALELGGNQRDAAGVLSDWLRSHPDDLIVRSFDADSALRSRDFARAASGYRAVVKARPNNWPALNNLAWTLFEQKDAEALTYARKAMEVAPNNPTVKDTMGWILVEQGDVKKGLEYLQQARATAPQRTDIVLHVAKAQLKDGRKDEARATLEVLAKNAPDSLEGKESRSLMANLNPRS